MLTTLLLALSRYQLISIGCPGWRNGPVPLPACSEANYSSEATNYCIFQILPVLLPSPLDHDSAGRGCRP